MVFTPLSTFVYLSEIVCGLGISKDLGHRQGIVHEVSLMAASHEVVS
jgi:hypothetical protein